MELSDNQLYNNIITAHAILVIYFIFIPVMMAINPSFKKQLLSYEIIKTDNVNNLSLDGKAKLLAKESNFFFNKSFKFLVTYLVLGLIVWLTKFPASYLASQ